MPKIAEHVFVRPPWARMMRIHQALQRGGFPNSAKLARDLEVCARTIKRDVQFMQDRLDLPIEYDSRRYGYYYSRKVEQFPGVPVTEAEVFALLVAHKAIAQYQGTPFQRPLETAFRKLVGQLDKDARYTLGSLDEALSFRPFAPEDTDLATFQVLAQAVQARQAVTFRYKNLGARHVKERHVHPYHLACIENHWYLFGFDVDRQALRTFVLTRLSRPRLADERFPAPKDFDPDKFLRGSFTVYEGKDDYEVVIDFDLWATDLLRGRKWHASQEFTHLPDGCSRLRMRLNNIEEIEHWVLSWGAHATVVRPVALIKRLQQTAEHLQTRYAELPPPARNS